MAVHALFIHSAGAQSGEQGSAPFLRHLREDLGPAIKLAAPKMPAPTKPSYERWRAALDEHLAGAEGPLLLIGHSLGGSVLLKYLSEGEREVPAAGLFLVATPFWDPARRDVHEFALHKDFAKALPDGLRIHLYRSHDDELVPSEQLDRYAEALPQAKAKTLDGGGHAFKTGLPDLADDIRSLSAEIGS